MAATARQNDPQNHPQRTAGRIGRMISGCSRPIRQLAKTPFRVVVILGVTLIIVTGLGVALSLLQRWPQRVEFVPSAERTLEALDGERWDEARWLAGQLRQVPEQEPEAVGISAYVLGKVMFHTAEEKADYDEQRTRYVLSARYLEEADQRGVPEGRVADLVETLGNAWYFAERWPLAQAPLKRAIALNSARSSRLHRRLANALLRDPKGNAADAAEHIQAFLGDASIDSRERLEGQLELAEIRMKSGDQAGCLEVVATIPKEADEYARALVLRGRIDLERAQRESDSAEERTDESIQRIIARYRTALESFREAETTAGSDEQAERQAMYFAGICQKELGDYANAEEVFRKTRRLHFNSPEGFAAQLEEAEIQLAARKFEEALQSYERLLSHLDDPQQYSNIWVPLAELRMRIERAFGVLKSEKRFDDALELTDSLEALFPESFTTELRADGNHAYADFEFATAKSRPEEELEKLEAQARTHARAAAQLYERLAELRRGAKENPDYLARSARNYIRGQDYRNAIRLLKAAKETQPRKSHAPFLIDIAEAELALGNDEASLRSCTECLQFFARHPLTFKARLIASSALAERGELTEAKKHLLENLENDNLTPESVEWRNSLFALGRLLYQEGLEYETKSRLVGVDSDDLELRKAGLKELEVAYGFFHEGANRLAEALSRFPGDPQGIEARYYLGDAYRRSAMLPRKRLPTINIETTRLTLTREMQEHLTNAVSAYRDCLNALNQKDGRTLNALERAIQRNATFAVADSLFDLSRFDEAIRAYSTVTSRYETAPEALEAYLQIASCHFRVDRPKEAAAAIEQAKAVLQLIPPEVTLTRTTRFDRTEWKQLLDWLGTAYRS